MSRFRLALLVVLASAFAAAAFAVVPRGIDAQAWLSAQDDPAALADRALDAEEGHDNGGVVLEIVQRTAIAVQVAERVAVGGLGADGC